jgi:hypothetical protein
MAKGQKKQKFTEETIRKLEEVFAIDWTVWEACFYADISWDTYYRWIKENPELSEKFNRLREKPVLKARMEVVKWLNDKEFAMKYLKNKRNKEFNERSELTWAEWAALIPTAINIIKWA